MEHKKRNAESGTQDTFQMSVTQEKSNTRHKNGTQETVTQEMENKTHFKDIDC